MYVLCLLGMQLKLGFTLVVQGSADLQLEYVHFDRKLSFVTIIRYHIVLMCWVSFLLPVNICMVHVLE